jgi:hypothetical protein
VQVVAVALLAWVESQRLASRAAARLGLGPNPARFRRRCQRCRDWPSLVRLATAAGVVLHVAIRPCALLGRTLAEGDAAHDRARGKLPKRAPAKPPRRRDPPAPGGVDGVPDLIPVPLAPFLSAAARARGRVVTSVAQVEAAQAMLRATPEELLRAGWRAGGVERVAARLARGEGSGPKSVDRSAGGGDGGGGERPPTPPKSEGAGGR